MSPNGTNDAINAPAHCVIPMAGGLHHAGELRLVSPVGALRHEQRMGAEELREPERDRVVRVAATRLPTSVPGDALVASSYAVSDHASDTAQAQAKAEAEAKAQAEAEADAYQRDTDVADDPEPPPPPPTHPPQERARITSKGKMFPNHAELAASLGVADLGWCNGFDDVRDGDEGDVIGWCDAVAIKLHRNGGIICILKSGRIMLRMRRASSGKVRAKAKVKAKMKAEATADAKAKAMAKAVAKAKAKAEGR
eukprot:gene34885-27878_t